ncbi:hypothetical protein CVT25_005568 [Psilocybe cyanescens]|uniref:Uncharacterized protein n=1 Tax=Psilocybe cyanescens TaxID=93625 RepID=A0A409XSA6_PSICY|nr:hypothetical protein CVT25_005568 [Psilocybe cyanescens]
MAALIHKAMSSSFWYPAERPLCILSSVRFAGDEEDGCVDEHKQGWIWVRGWTDEIWNSRCRCAILHHTGSDTLEPSVELATSAIQNLATIFEKDMLTALGLTGDISET